MAQKKANKKSYYLKTLLLILLLVVFIVAVIMVRNGYAKLVSQRTGSATAQTAKMICNMTAVPNEANSEIIDPYCIVTVNNYNILENNQIERTEVNLQYKLEVVPQSSVPELQELPTYSWERMDGTVIQEGGYLTGTLTNTEDTQVQYKVVFDNPGTTNITAVYDVKVTAVQVEPGQGA